MTFFERSLHAALLWTLTACAGSRPVPPRELPPTGRLRPIDAALAEAGYERVDDWMQAPVPPHGLSLVVEVPAHQCAAVLAIAPEHRRVTVTLARRAGPAQGNVGWLESCVEQAASLPFQVSSTPGTELALAAYVGPSAQAHETIQRLLASASAPPAPPPETAAPSPPPEEPPPPPEATVQNERRVRVDFLNTECAETSDLRASARARYEEARQALREGDLEAAAAGMTESYACVPDGTTLFNLAGIRARQGQYEEARRLYRELLTRHPNLPEARRREVEAALGRLREPGRLRVRTRRGDRVYVNGVQVRVGRRRASARVMPGRAKIVLVDAEDQRWTVEADVRPGRPTEVDPRQGSGPP